MNAQVSIGDFAVMTSLSRKALRHYHDIGILEPAHIDSHTGYRFYDTSQVDHAHIIRRFRSLGMSIPDIGSDSSHKGWPLYWGGLRKAHSTMFCVINSGNARLCTRPGT